jgi:hypothetical protein
MHRNALGLILLVGCRCESQDVANMCSTEYGMCSVTVLNMEGVQSVKPKRAQITPSVFGLNLHRFAGRMKLVSCTAPSVDVIKPS